MKKMTKITNLLITIILLFVSVTVFSQAPGENVYYEGEIYPNEQIGDYYWMTKNLNVGQMITNWYTMPMQSDNQIIEKYCYDNDTNYCNQFGGLYSWDELMMYNSNINQGICPLGWHIPTLMEWNNLITQYPFPSGNDSLVIGGPSGFDAILGGYANNTGGFYGSNIWGIYWSSTEAGSTQAYRKGFRNTGDVVSYVGDKNDNYAIRCVRDNNYSIVLKNISLTTTDVLCNGDSTGTATLLTNGFSNPTFLWNTGDTIEDLYNLPIGNYSVTVSEGGQIFIATGTISQPSSLVSSIQTLANITCVGGSNGALIAGGFGGTAPYTYDWCTGDVSASVYNLNSNTYDVTITDVNGCSIMDSYFIDDPTPEITVIDSVHHITCNGNNDGSIYIDPTGLSFQWYVGSSYSYLENLMPGDYTVTISNSIGCLVKTYTIIEPEALVMSNTVINASTEQTADGSILGGVIGGTAPYTYDWSTGDNTQDISGIVSGYYFGTVTDANGCTDVDAIHVGFNDIQINYSGVMNVTQYGLADGSIFVMVNPTYGWPQTFTVISETDTIIQTNGFFDNLAAGVYDVIIENIYGDSAQLNLEVCYDIIDHTIVLESGWNIISSYVYPYNYVFTDLFDNVDIAIVKDDVGRVYWPDYGVTQLNDWDIDEAYLVKTNTTDSITLTGPKIHPESNPIALPYGWSFMAYQLDYETDLETSLNDILSSIIIVKNSEGLVYWPEFGVSLIPAMVPDEGYQIKLFYPDTFNYTTNTPSLKSSHVSGPKLGPNMTLGIPMSAWDNYPENGSIVSVTGTNIFGQGVFKGEFLPITIWGSDDSEISIQVDNTNVSGVFDNIFEVDKITVVEQLNYEYSSIIMKNEPNPFTEWTRFSYILPTDDLVTIQIFDLNGCYIETIVNEYHLAGNYTIQYQTSLKNGVYLCVLQTSNQSKVIKITIL